VSPKAEVAIDHCKGTSVLHILNFSDNIGTHDWKMLYNILRHSYIANAERIVDN
jgi:hypothetical protein